MGWFGTLLNVASTSRGWGGLPVTKLGRCSRELFLTTCGSPPTGDDEYRRWRVRGGDNRTSELFCYVELEPPVRRDHPVRAIWTIVTTRCRLSGANLPGLFADWQPSIRRRSCCARCCYWRFIGSSERLPMLFRCWSEAHLLRKAPALSRLSASSNSGLSRSHLCQWLRSERLCGNTNEFQAAEAETFRGFVSPWLRARTVMKLWPARTIQIARRSPVAVLRRRTLRPGLQRPGGLPRRF
jgi:hypothetical protein